MLVIHHKKRKAFSGLRRPVLSPFWLRTTTSLRKQLEIHASDHRMASAAYSDAPGGPSADVCNLLASSFAFFP